MSKYKSIRNYLCLLFAISNMCFGNLAHLTGVIYEFNSVTHKKWSPFFENSAISIKLLP